jgi:Bacterial lipocalin
MRTTLVIMMLSFITQLWAAPPKTVGYVDLAKYAGLWYEIAKYPKWYEKGMTQIRAEYIPMGDYIRVINSGIKKGKIKQIKGKAFVVKNSGNAKLRVQFFWPFKGDYWIIGLADDYSWAVVSDKKRSSLWILSRTPHLAAEIYDAVLGILRSDGFDLSKLVKTEQNGS